MPPQSTPPRTPVYLVGAGPGDPGLVTLRAVECLGRADLVLYDYLVNPRLLQYAPTAECICLGRHGQGRLWSQDEINSRMVAAAHGGKVVVRLKAGDPMLFARAAEEIEALEAAGLSYEIVPGITAALAVGSYTGIPLTDRDERSAVALVTGHERGDKPAPSLDYAALARFPGTLVFYMGVTSAMQWAARLIEAGKPPDTTTTIVRRCTFPDQQVFPATLATVAEVIAKRHVRPPAVILVGCGSRWGRYANWFAARPLAGQCVLVTRPREQGPELGRKLEELGASVLYEPAIEIAPPDDWAAVDRQLDRLEQFDWLVFSSTNGVHWFFRRLADRGDDARRLAGLKVAAIGTGTAAALAAKGVQADRVPDEFRAEALAAALAVEAPGKRFLLARASRGRELLSERLTAAGGVVEQAVVYTSRDVSRPSDEALNALRTGRASWTTVTSSAIAESLVRLFGQELRKTRLASISPLTSAALRSRGYSPQVEAANYTTDGLIDAIVGNRAPQPPPAGQSAAEFS